MPRKNDLNLQDMFDRCLVDQNGCWIWQGYVEKSGHIRVRNQGKRIGIHVFTYQLVYGPIPDGWEVHHKCITPSCCNPEHLMACSKRDHYDQHIGTHKSPSEFCKKCGANDWYQSKSLKKQGRTCKPCQLKRQRDPNHVPKKKVLNPKVGIICPTCETDNWYYYETRKTMVCRTCKSNNNIRAKKIRRGLS